MTFKDWVKNKLKNGDYPEETPERDFAEDVISDKKFRDFRKWSDLECYLVFHGACREAVKVAKLSFAKWALVYGKTKSQNQNPEI